MGSNLYRLLYEQTRNKLIFSATYSWRRILCTHCRFQWTDNADETQMFSNARVINVHSWEQASGEHGKSLARMEPIFLFLIRFTADSGLCVHTTPAFVYNIVFHFFPADSICIFFVCLLCALCVLYFHMNIEHEYFAGFPLSALLYRLCNKYFNVCGIHLWTDRKRASERERGEFKW